MSVDNERRARELLAFQYEKDGQTLWANEYVRRAPFENLPSGDSAALRAIMAALDEPAGAVDGWQHVANEYADMATSGIQWIRNIRDGINTPEEAIKNMMECLKHCEQVRDAQPKQTGSVGGEALIQRYAMAKGSDGLRWSVYMERCDAGEWVKWREVQQHVLTRSITHPAPPVVDEASAACAGGEVADNGGGLPIFGDVVRLRR